MNRVVLVGNLTKDPQMRTTHSGTPVCSFTIACNRKYKGADGTYGVDYIDCVAWRQMAEFVKTWFTKGKSIGLEGSLQSRTYEDKNGQKRYAMEVVADNVEFVGRKEAGGGSQTQRKPPSWYGDDTGKTTINEHFAEREEDVFAGDIDQTFTPIDEAELPF